MPFYYIDGVTFSILKRGLFAVNKTKGITSAKTLEIIKSVIAEGRVEKSKERPYTLNAGHGGTLDSSATGVLVVGLLDGCKLLSGFLHGFKKYEVIGKLGSATDTYNSLGTETYSASYDHITESKLQDALIKYHGRITQVPPKYSALKRNGKRLSDLVRQGEDVNVEGREVLCQSISLTKFVPPFFHLSISCGSGFYVRSLIHDIGQDLGSYAHVTELVRTCQGPFTLEDCLSKELWTKHNILEAVSDSRSIIENYFSIFTLKKPNRHRKSV